MGLIYHIALPGDWEQAQRDGAYLISTRGRTLAQEGYIHASLAGQVALVANAFYADLDDLVVLAIDTDLVAAPIRLEQLPGSDQAFPHIYGPLNTDAVTGVLPLRRGTGGRHEFEGIERGIA